MLGTLKAEIIVGFQEGQAETLAMAGPGWLVNGREGSSIWYRTIEGFLNLRGPELTLRFGHG